MRNLILPEGIASVSAFDKTFAADEHGTIRDLEDHEAAAIMAHDPRITEFAAGEDGDPAKAPGADDRKVRFLARVARLDRTEMFAAGRSMKVSLPANMRTEQMRETLLMHAAAADPDNLPMIVGGDVVDGAPSALMGDDVLDPNHGNAGLGRKGAHLTGQTGGATFSQEIAAPVLNPHTGKPFDADDPRNPAPAGAVLIEGREIWKEGGIDGTFTPGPGEQLGGDGEPVVVRTAVEAYHEALDAHEISAAAEINDAAENLRYDVEVKAPD